MDVTKITPDFEDERGGENYEDDTFRLEIPLQNSDA